MGKNLYVGNLAWETTSDDLLALFSKHGAVALAQVMTDHDTGRSRGFGFVQMSDEAEARKTIAALNGHEYRGRALTVKESKPRADRSGAGRRPDSSHRNRQN